MSVPGESVHGDSQWSWFLTFIALLGLFWLDHFGTWSPDAGALCVLLILVMGISAKVFQVWPFKRRGMGNERLRRVPDEDPHPGTPGTAPDDPGRAC